MQSGAKIGLMALLVFLYLVFCLKQEIRTGRVPHRFYLLEKNKRYEFATAREHWFEYWVTLLLHLLLALFFGWLAFVGLFASAAAVAS